MSDNKEIAVLELPNGRTVHAEVTLLGGEEEVSFDILRTEEIRGILEGVASIIASSVEKLRPAKTAVEFSLELAVEAGKLTALIAQGSGKASLKVTLEWND
jgi:Trypsin-co-occurring domain 1